MSGKGYCTEKFDSIGYNICSFKYTLNSWEPKQGTKAQFKIF